MKIYIFLKTLSSSHFQSNQALNQPWVLEFQHHWGTGGSTRKGYKMSCLKMPLFWFVSSANGIKRIRDKTFWFDTRLKPNPCTRQTTHVHGVGCNSTELRGILMSEALLVLLEKRAMTASLSQKLFCQLQGKGTWLTIKESLKGKTNMANGHKHQRNKTGSTLNSRLHWLQIKLAVMVNRNVQDFPSVRPAVYSSENRRMFHRTR